jgi:hypothetical protein
MPVTEPRDEIDNWLGREVEPLAPRPGSFERIQRRARRRKLNQALLAATGAVVVIAGAVLAPTLASGVHTGNSSPKPPVASASRSSKSPAPTPTTSAPSASAAPSSSQAAGGTALSDTSSGTSPPAHFRPTSITMVGTAVGAVIGQAGPPCATQYCTSLAGTSTYGASWYGVSAPLTGVPHGSLGVSQLRFLELYHGWAFGPQLYETSTGGRAWLSMQTYGLRVTDLEAAGNRAFALLANCQGTSTDYAADCSTFSLYSAVAGSTTLQQVTLKIPASLRSAAMGTAGQASSASLVIAGVAGDSQAGTGYLLAPSGDILKGSVGGGAWTYAGKAPCLPGSAAASGAPLGGQLTVANGTLLLNCASGNSSAQPKQLWKSAGGASWSKVSQPPATGTATSLASASSGQVVLATSAGIDYSPDGVTWQAATISGGSPRGGFSYVGMTSPKQGAALPADASLGEMFTTGDGGQTWTASAISG